MTYGVFGLIFVILLLIAALFLVWWLTMHKNPPPVNPPPVNNGDNIVPVPRQEPIEEDPISGLPVDEVPATNNNVVNNAINTRVDAAPKIVEIDGEQVDADNCKSGLPIDTKNPVFYESDFTK